MLIWILKIMGIIATVISGSQEEEEIPQLPKCPRECICEIAPLRSAPFVLTWMTSWGEDDLPNVHPNEVLNAEMLASSDTATDANVDVDVVGVHATCSLHQTTNITTLLGSLPSTTMVLSILQAPGCNFTIVDGGQLVGLSSLRALHLQGYAHIKEQQVSGFQPNRVHELITHKKLIEQEVKRDADDPMRDLRLALAEDALQPLNGLQLLDLQYVRLVASKDARRSRRYSKEPVASTTLLDMPLMQFLRLANKVDSFYLPPHLHRGSGDRSSGGLPDHDDDDRQIESLGESYKLQRNMFTNEIHGDGVEISLKSAALRTGEGDGDDEALTDERQSVVPYSIYKAEMQPQLAPFKTLAQLKYLRVAHARLDRIGVELLDGLQQLHTLTLEYNNIKILPAGLVAPTPNLRHLSLAHNNVLLLDSDSLEGLTKLLTIDLDYNRLSVLGPATFPSLPSLKTLRISDNPVTHLLPDTFATLNSTENIFLGSYNVSMDVHENSFRFLYNVNKLVVNNISLESLQKTLLNGMPGVQRLTIHGKIPTIDYDAFSTTPNLKSLNLSHCHLSVLSLDAFYGLKQLVELDLSHNELHALSPGTFDYLTSLRSLYLSDNHLTTLPLGIFIPIPAKLIQLHNNPWHCTCDLLQLRPSITNKVKRAGHVACHWDDTLFTVCKKTKERLVYDARVAPLCHEPSELEGNDVYHAALRHLKCSKYHWDPRLLLSTQKKKTTEITRGPERQSKAKNEEDKDGWLPLTAFTPEPIDTEDLLEIAEQEGLEEVIESTTRVVFNATSEYEASEKVEKSEPQNDEPESQKQQPPKWDSGLTKDEYREQKASIKAQLKIKEKIRRREKGKLFKKTYLKDKTHLKEVINNRLKNSQKQNHKEDEEGSDNLIHRENLKSNVDIY